MKIIKKTMNMEAVSYLIFGVLTTAVNYVSYFIFDRIFYGFHFNTAISTVLSWICAVIFAYITNKLFVFKSKSFRADILKKEVTAFLAARIASLIFEVIWMMITVDVLYGYLENISIIESCADMTGIAYADIYKFAAKVTAGIFVIIMNYFFSKLFIFKDNGGEQN